MKKCILILILIIRLANAGTSYQAIQNNKELNISCDNNNNCQLQAIDHSNNKKILIHAEYLLTEKTIINWHGKTLIEFTTGNGSENFITSFFDFKSMQYQSGFYNMIFVDSVKNIIISENEQANTFVMQCIFDKDVKPITVFNDASYGVLDWDSVQQISSTKVKFGYYDSKGNEQYQTITLNLNCNKEKNELVEIFNQFGALDIQRFQ